jgi:hypothetical protein
VAWDWLSFKAWFRPTVDGSVESQLNEGSRFVIELPSP